MSGKGNPPPLQPFVLASCLVYKVIITWLVLPSKQILAQEDNFVFITAKLLRWNMQIWAHDEEFTQEIRGQNYISVW